MVPYGTDIWKRAFARLSGPKTPSQTPDPKPPPPHNPTPCTPAPRFPNPTNRHSPRPASCATAQTRLPPPFDTTASPSHFDRLSAALRDRRLSTFRQFSPTPPSTAHQPRSSALPAYCASAPFFRPAIPLRTSPILPVPILRSEPTGERSEANPTRQHGRDSSERDADEATRPRRRTRRYAEGEGSEVAPAQPNLTCGRLFRWRPLWRRRSLRSALDARASFPSHPPASPPCSSPDSIPR